MFEGLVDERKLRRRLCKHCASDFEDGCELEEDESASCPVMQRMLEGAGVFLEELGIKTTFNVDPLDPKSECPFESHQRSEAWCMLEDGALCHGTDCPLKLGAVLVKVG